jgi:general secretion pathway protein K
LDDGEMEVTIIDGSNCFNLNSVVSSEGNRAEYRVNPKGMFDFARLLDLIDARGARMGFAAALVDWIDTDRSVTAGGAEDLGGGYVTANTLIGDVSELRNLRGFDETAMQRLAPFVCVRPTAAPSVINPNTLSVEQAPLLAMLIPGLNVDGARQIIRERPAGGWRDIQAFLRHPTLNAMQLTDVVRSQFSVQPRYFVVRIRVEREGANETSIALIDANGGGDGVVVRRVFGAGAPGHLL